MLRIRRGARGGDVIKVALTGDSALELPASFFTDAGYSVMPQDVKLEDFKPDFVYDLTAHDEVLAGEVEGFIDERMRRLSGSKYSRNGLMALVQEFAWEVEKAPKKILAVDADNTLWRGILSEDGAENLKPFTVFQQGLKDLRDAGVVLVLLSKNDDFLSSPSPLPLDLSLFAAQKVNWRPKAGNLLEICRELKLAPDSVVFVDDNPHERAQMKAHLPEVTVAPWNGFPEGDTAAAEAQLVRRLKEYFFFAAGVTEEDRLRAVDYAYLKTREDYLGDLKIWVKGARAEAKDLDRLAQMAGKTNQFNATTIRRTREELAALLPRTFVFRSGDRFGEQGLICYIIVDEARERITDFVMSCRAMGRRIEFAALEYVERELGRTLPIDCVETAKNKPFRDFLKELNRG